MFKIKILIMLIVSISSAMALSPNYSKNNVRMYITEDDMNILLHEVISKNFIGIKTEPYIFNWNNSVNELQLFVTEILLNDWDPDFKAGEYITAAAGSVPNELSLFEPVVSKVANDVRQYFKNELKQLAVALTNKAFSGIQLPNMIGDFPLIFSIRVKSMVVDFIDVNTMSLETKIGLYLSDEIGDVTISTVFNPLEDEHAIIKRSTSPDGKENFELCPGNIAFQPIEFSYHSRFNIPELLDKEINSEVESFIEDAQKEASGSCMDLLTQFSTQLPYFDNIIVEKPKLSFGNNEFKISSTFFNPVLTIVPTIITPLLLN